MKEPKVFPARMRQSRSSLSRQSEQAARFAVEDDRAEAAALHERARSLAPAELADVRADLAMAKAQAEALRERERVLVDLIGDTEAQLNALTAPLFAQ